MFLADGNQSPGVLLVIPQDAALRFGRRIPGADLGGWKA
jgi:hypothetical protein